MAITYPNRVYREREVMDIWNEHNEDIDEFLMRKDRAHLPAESKEEGVYFVAFDGEQPVGYTGWTDKGDHYKTAGVKILPKNRDKRIAARLMVKRMEKLDKPSVAVFNNIESGWANHWKNRGWVTFDEASGEIDQSILDKYKKFKRTTLIYLPDDMTKAWNILCPITDEEVLKFEEC